MSRDQPALLRLARLGGWAAGGCTALALSLGGTGALAHPDHHQPTQQGQNSGTQQQAGPEHDHEH